MKPSDNKLRGGSTSALTALKARCKREFERDGASSTLEKILSWASEIIKREGKDSTRTNAEIRQLIGEFFKIQLERDSQLSSFFGWVKLERKVRSREAAVEHLLQNDRLAGVPESQLDEKGRKFFKAISIAEEDPESFVQILSGQTRAAHRERELNLAEQKFAETKKDDQTKALELCLEDAKPFPEVLELFKSAFAALKKAKGAKRQ